MANSDQAERGVITLATGRTSYADMAADMALSYRQFHPEPISIVTDDSTGPYIQKQYGQLFDHVLTIPPRFNAGRLRKYCVAKVSPYHHALFLDADIILLNTVQRLWTESMDQPMTMIGDMLTLESDYEHHGYSTRMIMQEFNLNRYLKTNSGCFAFMTHQAQSLFAECVTTFEALQDNQKFEWLGDELAFGIVGGRHKLPRFALPSPMIWDPVKLQVGDTSTPIFHYISDTAPATLEWLYAGILERRRAAGISTRKARVWLDRMSAKSGFLYRPTQALKIASARLRKRLRGR